MADIVAAVGRALTFKAWFDGLLLPTYAIHYSLVVSTDGSSTNIEARFNGGSERVRSAGIRCGPHFSADAIRGKAYIVGMASFCHAAYCLVGMLRTCQSFPRGSSLLRWSSACDRRVLCLATFFV